MKIAFVSQPFAHVGLEGEDSITIWTHRVLQAIDKPGDDIIIYCRKLPGFPQIDRRNNIEYRRLPAAVDQSLTRFFKAGERLLHHPRPKRPFFASWLNYLIYGLSMSWDLRNQSCDIVHVHNFTQFIPLIRFFNPQIKIVLHMHCEWLSQLDAKMIADRLAKTDLIIGCSQHVVEKVQNRFPQFANRCHVVPNGVDVEQFGVPLESNGRNTHHPQHLLYVGRISPEKGLHILLKAMEIVLTQIQDVQLDIIGGFGSAPFEYLVLVSDEDSVRDLNAYYKGWRYFSDYAHHLQRELPPHLKDHVNFVGELPHEKVVAYYHRADVLVNPSLSEAFGLSLVEAMAAKIPVIATNVGGMKEIIAHEKTGLLVDPTNSAALAKALLNLLNDDKLCNLMGAAGLRRVTRLYTWEVVAGQLWKKYSWLMKRTKTDHHAMISSLMHQTLNNNKESDQSTIHKSG